jgi:hypothetical protein
MTRDQQLIALKALALDKTKLGDYEGAIKLMINTIEKIDGHPVPLWVRELGQVYLLERNPTNVAWFIEGFN